MPEPSAAVPVRAIAARWASGTIDGPGTLRLDDAGIEVAGASGARVHAPWEALGGAAWRVGHLALHGRHGESIVVDDDQGLDGTWVALVAHACPVPEFTRGLRWLGSPRGGHAAAQARFLAPFLQARRRLEDEPDLDRRVAAFDAGAIGERLDGALAGIAAGLYPESAPDRRALEAELGECVRPLHRALAGLDAAARAFGAAPDESRFVAWHAWVDAVQGVFSEADRAWGAALAVLPSAPPPRRRRWWRGRGGRVVAILVTAMAAGAL